MNIFYSTETSLGVLGEGQLRLRCLDGKGGHFLGREGGVGRTHALRASPARAEASALPGLSAEGHRGHGASPCCTKLVGASFLGSSLPELCSPEPRTPPLPAVVLTSHQNPSPSQGWGSVSLPAPNHAPVKGRGEGKLAFQWLNRCVITL